MSPSFVPARPSVSRSMATVGLALLPGAAVLSWAYGSGVATNLLLACAAAAGSEALVLWLRGREPRALGDGSALLSGALLALSLPAAAPWWLPVLGAIVAITLGKQVFGGLGDNPFNPAMVGYVVLLVSFPLPMTQWPLPFGEIDAATSATVLDRLRNGLRDAQTVGEALAAAPDHRALQRSLALAWLAGGALLLATRTIRWTIPLAVLTGLLLPAALAHGLDPDRHAAPGLHLLAGASVFGALFIATDPVSAATTTRGRWLYGLGIGALTWLIRRYGGYPDGFAFAVLLMNLCVPLLDRLRPPVVGRGRVVPTPDD